MPQHKLELNSRSFLGPGPQKKATVQSIRLCLREDVWNKFMHGPASAAAVCVDMCSYKENLDVCAYERVCVYGSSGMYECA